MTELCLFQDKLAVLTWVWSCSQRGLSAVENPQLPSHSGPSSVLCLVAATDLAWTPRGITVGEQDALLGGARVSLWGVFSCSPTPPLPASYLVQSLHPTQYSRELGLGSQLVRQTQKYTWGQYLPPQFKILRNLHN